MASRRELSPREVEVVELIVAGHAYEEIAYQMDLSKHTVRAYARTAAWKLKLGDGSIREVLIHWWYDEGRKRYRDDDMEPRI